VALEASVVDDVQRPERIEAYVGKEKYYCDVLVFFQKEMEQKGWEEVHNQYVFSGDARADGLLVRMYAGE
jgi:hypothetical protein